MHVLHVGDSRLYRFRDGALVRLTTDHAQAGTHILTRAIGAAESVRVDDAEEAARPHARTTRPRARLLASQASGTRIAATSNAAKAKPAGVARAVARRETDLPMARSTVALISSGCGG
jgi:hypothetical protein